MTQHAKKRMRERNIRFNDIVSCARTLRKISEQKDGTFRVEGQDLEGDEVTVIAAYDGTTVIVTLF